MKDKDENHFSLPFLCGGCDRAFLAKCYTDYQAVASYKVNKDGQLQPENYMKAVNVYMNKHLPPLDVHPLQAIRLMLLEKYYQLGEKWCKPGTHLLQYCFSDTGFRQCSLWVSVLFSAVCYVSLLFLLFTNLFCL
jgi:hypothetical protein